MNGKELYNVDQNMAQNEVYGKYETQQTQAQPYGTSQPQSQQYIPPPQPQGYEASQPQSQQYMPPPQPQGYGTSQPQSQQYIPPPQPQGYGTSQPQSPQYIPPPQPQTYGASQPYQQPETPQPQPYQSSQPQTYQQSQPQSYQSPQTPYINPPVTNNMYQGGSNQSSNYVMSQNQNALLDNYKPFQDDKNTPTRGRLACQMVLAILLLLLSIVTIIDFLNIRFRINSIYILMMIITNILNLIIGIWMIILFIKKQTARNNLLGILSLISIFILIFRNFLYVVDGYNVSGFELIEFIILIIVTSFNMKSKCCD